ncbi:MULTISPECIES: iron-containing alcohol dehydrogenase [Bacillales]|jgi:alcohol dehydrogenase|uniref:Butanol dehydrogenase n=1 Tax=Brevibacillus aydinogluensis TaxID=927786 RepID=A0AA48M4J3_9BACL|nr:MULTISPECIES: iron-containing alcohol dehydrogenase [Bacillales]REK61050.1 MAG: NADH-dependent alcohol dehydrogenase [Brevibacillus sp.]MBR8661423.1 iron-containing alcohol dehydrogenase [Brevibacillus sp. NL20B1]MDT3417683.1 alcohol dehydrogenase YqhD (iron-dependent ADH family) [Brevibacillus aydinogluensis]NNV04286.1 iron-containing alcohol dehydrogenase [Brevibacillus sp. MCWH]UFJ61916.1 iron-containing alcohol dehydrogenase [Anoxybacillus sediminis]
MDNFVYHNPTELIFGRGQLEKLKEKAAQLGSTVLLVYGGGSIKRNGLYDKVIALLQAAGCTIHELPGVEPNPRLSTVKKGIELCRRERVDWILAVGGGSVIDASKAIAVGVPYEGDVWDFYTRKAQPQAALPLGTVLTLAATGSEMNRGSVVTNWETKEKFGAGTTFPTFSILDPENTFSVPRDQTVYGICDMLSHVFEQYFTHTQEIPLQTRFAESIMKTVIEYAERVLANPEDYDARATILYCGTMALNGTLPVGVETDWATHSIEHAVSAVYDIPHGGGLAIIFPKWMRYVYRENVERFKRFAVEVWGVDPSGKTDDEVALEGIAATEAFFARIGAPTRLADYQIGDEHLELMAEKATPFGPIGRFKKLTSDDVAAILRMCL